jgi:hypothetical protein
MHDAQWAVDETIKLYMRHNIPPIDSDNFRLITPLQAVSQKYQAMLIKKHNRVVFNLKGFVRVLEKLSTEELPYPLAEKVTHPIEDKELLFKFKTPLMRPLVKIFAGGSINILSCKHKGEADAIHEFLSNTITKYWMELTGVIPYPDVEGLGSMTITNMPAVRRGAKFEDAQQNL